MAPLTHFLSMPKRRTCYFIIGDIVVGVVVIAAIPPILSLIGFGSAGPLPGSLAAAIQSSIGNVVAGSPFAIAQAIGMKSVSALVYVAAGAGLDCELVQAKEGLAG